MITPPGQGSSIATNAGTAGQPPRSTRNHALASVETATPRLTDLSPVSPPPMYKRVSGPLDEYYRHRFGLRPPRVAIFRHQAGDGRDCGYTLRYVKRQAVGELSPVGDAGRVSSVTLGVLLLGEPVQRSPTNRHRPPPPLSRAARRSGCGRRRREIPP